MKSQNENKIKEKEIYSIKEYEIQNNSISYYEEDDYNSIIYDKPISKDKNYFYDKNDYPNYFFNTISSTNSFNSIKERYGKKLKNIFKNKSMIINLKSHLNFSFEENQNNINVENNNYKNTQNLIRTINIFNLIHKKQLKKIENYTLKSNEYNLIKSKYSKKIKNIDFKNTKNNRNDIITIHNRNISEYCVNSDFNKNKIIKLDINTNNEKNNELNNTFPKKVNFKMYDAYIMTSNFENILNEKEKEIILKENNIQNKTIKKLNININQNLINENSNINKSLIKNHSINYKDLKNNDSKRKTIINNYNNKERKIPISMNKSKNKEKLHKIIKKRIILEEEYLISPEGEKKLLSVKRLEKENNNNNSELLKNIFKREKKINENNSQKIKLRPKNSRHNSLFSSIFKEHSKKNEFIRTSLKTLDEDSQIVSNMSFYNSISNNSILKEGSNNIFKNRMIIPSHIKNRNNKNKNLYNMYKNKNLEINKEKLHEQNLNSESNNNELNLKKKLFYNKICLIKDKNINNFNKSNYNNNYSSNNTISCHTNFLNSNRTSINYIEDKEKLKNNSNKTIYQNISFSKEQPFMIYHKKKPKHNLILNNKQNCSNLVNIVFLNQEENNKIYNYDNYHDKENDNRKLNISHQKIPIHHHKYNYRFHEIKSNSIDNFLDNKANKYFYFNNNNATIMDENNSSYKLTNANDNIYSNKENYNINGNKYFEISNCSSRNINKIKLKKKMEQKNNSNNNITHYYIKY